MERRAHQTAKMLVDLVDYEALD
ncbi:uncharacterized protein G2W53_028595 [Senna tora]|uniref:Uncharacterized protein n=1 Tax=Senna tora TaxID=362788 RepID=A0A834WCZ0_9FABA|nr:uncharacterized protein G2W53_028595 [Senna tora]